MQQYIISELVHFVSALFLALIAYCYYLQQPSRACAVNLGRVRTHAIADNEAIL